MMVSVVKRSLRKSLSYVWLVHFPHYERDFLLNERNHMYIEITDAIAITIALTTSITLIITTAIRNAKLTRRVRELNGRK